MASQSSRAHPHFGAPAATFGYWVDLPAGRRTLIGCSCYPWQMANARGANKRKRAQQTETAARCQVPGASQPTSIPLECSPPPSSPTDGFFLLTTCKRNHLRAHVSMPTDQRLDRRLQCNPNSKDARNRPCRILLGRCRMAALDRPVQTDRAHMYYHYYQCSVGTGQPTPPPPPPPPPRVHAPGCGNGEKKQ